ncbi:histidine--tRNA ligase [Rhodoferax mekongensis]|uniref:histidine--tRNA ligase n=1 Tax=Rhodoferax mekongensis TaxID=3068341 RepID=UPI0028BEB8B4|nr:histidine--tRNA ligase [Rhodoferax sp. TBRC 17199]MDT7515695.1 histidine--tRNA ligase [Rhodoferax sp. TBRC 17199]
MSEKNSPRKADKIVAVKGMNDIMPPESAVWEALEARVRELMRRFSFENVRTPIVEPTSLFVRGLGEVTDIVEKEMYSFEDRLNGEALTLRPENTAGVVRAAVEHSILYNGPKRLYYMGPMFRHERPQRGRYRQFHQIGAEALGFGGAEIDAEVILMAHMLWKELGLADIELQINSLGQPNERNSHRAALIQHFESHLDLLDEEAKRRLHLNPLRLLDSKNPGMQAVIESAPKLIDFLGDASREHLETVKKILDAHRVSYTVNPRLVRGMDYYNLTVFEFVTTKLGSQGTVCAGGRYDYLIEQIGGKPAPAVGWAMGVERVLELIKESGVALRQPGLDVFAVITDVANLQAVMPSLQVLREAGLSVQMQASTSEGMPSMKSQFKRADASGARFAFVFGPDELASGQVTVKSLRDSNVPQATLRIDEMATWAASLYPTV